MPFCCVNGCPNQTKPGYDKNISYHILPKEESIRKEWIARLKRQVLPKYVYVCSEHFEDNCFDESVEMKRRLIPDLKTKRKLKKDAVPTKFWFQHTPTAGKIRGKNETFISPRNSAHSLFTGNFFVE